MQRRHKGTCLHVARDCMITWGFRRSARVHSPGGAHTRDKYTTGVLHMVCEIWAMHGRKDATPCLLKLNDHPMGVCSGQSSRLATKVKK